MSDEKTNLLRRIAEHSNEFSSKQRVFAEYLVKNYMTLAYSKLAEFGRLAGVSETTVVRFINVLGYDGLSEFKDALRDEIERSRNTVSKGLNRYSFEQDRFEFPKDAYRAIFSLEMQIMEETLARIDQERFQKAVDAIYSAPMLLVIACGTSRAYSQAAGFAFEVLRPNVHRIESLDLIEGAVINSIPPGALGLVFSAPRYPVAIQKILDIVKEREVFLIGMTDGVLSPIAPYCDILFEVPEKFVTFIDTSAAYLALIHSLAFGVYLKNPDYSKERMKEYNDFVRKSGYYVHDQCELIEF
ncbi:MAG: MurR/RpiR family transcriptional regulator [Synergistaceae bacterium]|jgi:DNA-binding MurR/RpiR family transcriptional regulator|nr:MurR/RpiR family transcriptional regulator [Synergistaceae bacterium]